MRESSSSKSLRKGADGIIKSKALLFAVARVCNPIKIDIISLVLLELIWAKDKDDHYIYMLGLHEKTV